MNDYKPEGALLDTPENRESLSSIAGLESAAKSGKIVEGVVTLCDSNLCLHVDLHIAEGIIKPEEAVYCRQGEERKEIAIISRVGKPVAFKILSLETQNGKNIVYLSRRLAQEEALKKFFLSHRPGDVIPAKVTHLEPFGAFLDIGLGVSSLLSVDCISVSRISHPRDRISVGDSLFVAVKQLDPESERVSVTLRELLGTWGENAGLFHIGQTVTGIVRSVESYGIFVELMPNLAGLAEIRAESDPEELRKMIGKSAAVYIKNIVPDRMKIKLVLIDTLSANSAAKNLPYFIDPQKTEHIEHWTYSPPTCQRVVETIF